MTGELDLWGDDPRPAADEGEGFVVDVAGFEGPLDLLLQLARNQKVDLSRISVLALADQYLDFVREARRLRLELAADYLVMAAWLAYLKSQLLLPKPAEEAPGGEEMAAALAFRLRRLEAMREAAARLTNRNRLGRDVFARGMPEGVQIDRKSDWQASLYDLLKAYGEQRSAHAVRRVVLRTRRVVGLKEARRILERLVGSLADWTPLEALIGEFIGDPELGASAVASSFSASLELAREGQIELRQEAAYAPLHLRAKKRTT